ncbi:MAG: ATP-binding protein [Victivallales bacterium]|nr:ATP-binding protein [Victivallales bacterium]
MKRKIDSILMNWRAERNHRPLLVRGARQVGKTYSIRQFGKSYGSFLEINFITNPEYREIFAQGYSVAAVLRQISFRNPAAKFIAGDTLIFFDELQACPDCATCLKFFQEDGRYDVVCSGSMMGVNYHEITSNSVGYKQDLTMYSLDFEEFLWGKGYHAEQIEDIYGQLLEMKPFTDGELGIMFEHFLDYAVVGGMPAIVQDYLDTGLFSHTLPMQRQLLLDYEEDIVKYAKGLDKAKIKSVYRHIPVALARENKKFQITKVAPNARSRDYAGCIDWLKDAGIIQVCHCLNFSSLPLKGNYDETKFKIYFHDNGLLVASLDDESCLDLRQNRNLGVYKGAIYENLVAEALVKSGAPLYYYKQENSQMEMDFFLRTTESLVPVEVKAKNGATASLRQLLQNHEKYPEIGFGVKLCHKNLGFNGKFYTMPYFCTFLLRRWLQDNTKK